MKDVSTRGVLLVNLGSPDSPSVGDVRRYLHEFLMDERVLDVAWPLRKFIVCCMILPRRPRESAHAYQSIWQPEGSPLIVISRRVRDRVQERLDVPVELGMRYGNPSVEAGLRALNERAGGSLGEALLVPLYPHYAMSSYETVVVLAREIVRRKFPGLKLSVVSPFYDEPSYIEALAASAEPYLTEPFDHLLFSYHGIPERHVRKSDPTGRHCLTVENCCQVDSPAHKTCYRAQVFKTTEALARKIGLAPDKYSVSFQSRLGRDPWLQPYTDMVLEDLARGGVRRLRVICPAFVSDCLETLEEIGMRGRDSFLEAGGEDFQMIPCLNDHPRWIETLAEWCRNDQSWQQAAAESIPNRG